MRIADVHIRHSRSLRSESPRERPPSRRFRLRFRPAVRASAAPPRPGSRREIASANRNRHLWRLGREAPGGDGFGAVEAPGRARSTPCRGGTGDSGPVPDPDRAPSEGRSVGSPPPRRHGFLPLPDPPLLDVAESEGAAVPCNSVADAAALRQVTPTLSTGISSKRWRRWAPALTSARRCRTRCGAPACRRRCRAAPRRCGTRTRRPRPPGSAASPGGARAPRPTDRTRDWACP